LETKIKFNKTKTFFDFFLASILLLVSLPLWPLIMLLIKIESKGPVFIMMWRCGKENKPFRMYKFRSMREDGNTRAHTIANDPRITRFGMIMRKTRIDEIPQVLNVIRGEMNFIGPRPERMEYIMEFKRHIPFYDERHSVKPGITGLAQVTCGYFPPTQEHISEKIRNDLYYIENRSMYLDILILFKTIATVLRRSGI
jgi:lipopolysaccharide/colanic/teichoic acid biosynthesis glycosyltransferase